MLKCIVIEDQYPAQQIMQKYIGEHGNLYLMKSFTDTIEAEKFLKDNGVELVFLDINLPQISGIEFLRKNNKLPPTILTTASSDFALESYEYNIVDYLLKPFSFERFKQAVAKISPSTQSISKSEDALNHTTDDIYIKSGHEILKLKSDEIVYIQSDGDYTKVVTDSKKHLSHYTLKDWLAKLDKNFCQVHKSYIVNMSHLNKISSSKIHVTGNHLLPIGRAYKKNFMDRYLVSRFQLPVSRF